jgi:hypothetical protein
MIGYASTALSKVEIQSNNAKAIMALSAYGHYVLVHTDAGVTVLTAGQSIDQSLMGWRVPQQSSGVKEGAANQSVVGWDKSLPYYLSADGQLYKAGSVTASSEEYMSYAEADAVSWKGRAGFAKYMDHFADAVATYEAESGMYVVNTRTLEHGVGGGFARKRQFLMFNDLTDSISGPFTMYPESYAVTSSGSSLIRVGNTGSDPTASKVYVTDLRDLREPLVAGSVDAGAPKAYYNSTDGTFAWGSRRLEGPFADVWVEEATNPSTLSGGTAVDDATVAWFETDWLHFGDEYNIKQLHEIVLVFDESSSGLVLPFAQAEDETIRKLGVRTLSSSNSRMKFFSNLRGRRFRFRVFVMTYRKKPWLLREMAMGYLHGKSY